MERNPYVVAAQKRMGEQSDPTDPYAMIDNPFLKLVAGNKITSSEAQDEPVNNSVQYAPGPTDWQGKNMPTMPDYVQAPAKASGGNFKRPNVDKISRPDVRKNPETGETTSAGSIPAQPATRVADPNVASNADYATPKDYFFQLFPTAESLKAVNGDTSLRGDWLERNKGRYDRSFNSPYVTKALDEIQMNKNLSDSQKKAIAWEAVKQAPVRYDGVPSNFDSGQYDKWKQIITQEAMKKSSAF